MTKGIIATLLAASFAASCAVKVQVKKEAKNSQLNSNATTQLSGSDTENFLHQLDGLRTNAADLLIKQMSQKDYVGTFRNSVRKYRKFIIEKASKETIITDSFYEDTKQECRESGLSLNADKNNEMLGMILKTVVLAKLSEADVGKLNAGMAKEMQAVAQFITMELGVEINGTSEVLESGSTKTTKGNVTIKLVPIAGEEIEDSVKLEDETQVLELNFERNLGSDMIGTFVSTIGLNYAENGNSKQATGSLTVSRTKSEDLFTHEVTMTLGNKDSTPAYSRQVRVVDIKNEKKKFSFTETLNAGTAKESRQETIVDLKAKIQCKVSSTPSTVGVTPQPVSPQPVVPIDSSTNTSNGSSNTSPVQMKGGNIQSPTQMKR